MNKYKDFPDAIYRDQTAEDLATRVAQYENLAHEYIPKDVFDNYLRGLKTYETVVFMLAHGSFDAAKQQELWKELEALKGYKLVHGLKDDSIPITTNHPFREALEQIFPTKTGNVKVYAKTKRDRLLDVIIYGYNSSLGVLTHRTFDLQKNDLDKYVAYLKPMAEAVHAQQEEQAKALVQADRSDIHALYNALDSIAQTPNSDLHKIVEQLALAGKADAQNDMGRYYYDGDGKNDEEAIKWFRKSVDKGLALAQYWLGAAYEYGHRVEKNLAEATDLYRKASDQGLDMGQLRLGYCYDQGNGVAQNFAEAMKWFRKAADQGNAEAQYCVGNLYFGGSGVERNFTEALKWVKMAVNNGFSFGTPLYAHLLVAPDRTASEHAEGIKLHRSLADQGDLRSQMELANIYKLGQIAPRNDVECTKYYMMAAKQGDRSAMTSLGARMAGGVGIKKDLIEAKKWLNKAVEMGDERAKTILQELGM